MQLYYNQYGVIPNVDLNRDSTPRYSAPGGFPDTGCDSSWFFITGSTTAGCSYDPGVNPPSTVSYSANTSFKDKMAEFLPALPKDPKTGQNINHGGGLYSRYGYILLENGVNYAYQLKVLLEGATGDLGSANRCSGILWSGTGTTPTNMQWDNATYGSHARVELCRL